MNTFQVKVNTERSYLINGFPPETYSFQKLVTIVKELMDQLEHTREELRNVSIKTAKATSPTVPMYPFQQYTLF